MRAALATAATILSAVSIQPRPGPGLWACGRGMPPRAYGAPPADGPPASTGASGLARGVESPSASAAQSKGRDQALSPSQARRYLVELINRDRASAGLKPVVLDEGAPGRAGQNHADDMATHGYLGHWGTDGSVPEQRLTEAGGADMVLENASCFTDERSRRLDSAPVIDARNVELTEDMFFHEVPPNDGHRKNILKPWHTRVGIGVAQPVATPIEIPTPCFTEEFVDSYGSYDSVPRSIRVGDSLHAEGEIAPSATFAGVGLARAALPHPEPVAELNRRRSYLVPAPYQTYWPAGFKTPIPVRVSGRRFAIDLPVSDGGKPGMYELSVWATIPGSSEFVMVSLRTIQVH